MVFYIFHSIALAHLAPNPRPFQIGTHPYSSLPVFWHAVFWHKQQRLHAIMMEFIVLIVDLCSHLSYSDFCRQFPSAWNLQFLKPHCGRSILIVHPPVCMLAATTAKCDSGSCLGLPYDARRPCSRASKRPPDFSRCESVNA